MNSIPLRRRGALRLVLAGAGLALAGCDKPDVPFHGIDLTGVRYGRDFHLTDVDGAPRTLADFKGKLVLLFFGFTQCPDVCPTALARAVEIKQLLGADGPRLQVLFVTVDPERDAPPMLKVYMQAFDPAFLGLYGDAAQTRAAADEFKVFYQKVPTGASYTMDHTALSFVFDLAAQLRLALRHEQNAQDCADDIHRIFSGAGARA